ncbi:DUF4156 domain-containing protein [Vibrio sp. M260118]|uniref:DUF4156 domain-containing protein n=1 Tax=Vibrio sp. M260118 TaxID=3020896 RepID=UPI002F42315B
MLARAKYAVAIVSLGMLAGCATPTTELHPDASAIHLRIDAQFDADDCQWLGEITGSEGHWYNYLFFANDVMIRGALNEAKNQAYELGANTVYLISPQDFVTSFTVMGNAYHCPK